MLILEVIVIDLLSVEHEGWPHPTRPTIRYSADSCIVDEDVKR